jgi:(E)-2-((N-methylformamido)methylene)succinate hydrolase
MIGRKPADALLQPFRLQDGTIGETQGVGPSLVLIHGVGLDRSMWAAQVSTFGARFRTTTYDLLGHGQSPAAAATSTLDDYVDQLQRIVSEVADAPAFLVGFSFGGLIARAYATAYPASVAGLVLMSTVYDRSPEERSAVLGRLAKARDQGLEAAIEVALERWFSAEYRHDRPDVIADLRRRFLANDRNSFLAAYGIFATADGSLAPIDRIRCPVLVMTGELDTGSSPAMARRMAAAIPAASCSIIPGGRHMMAVEIADDVNAELASFLAGVRGDWET